MARTENRDFIFFRKKDRRYRLAWLLRLFYRLLMLAWRPERGRMAVGKASHVSLCCIFKDEAPYLEEWIEYHRIVGVDHFYLYDNNSSDDYIGRIRRYMDEGVITLVRWEPEHAQAAAYEDCIQRYAGETDWLGFIDVDEFVVPLLMDTVGEFLDRFRNRPAVLVYWRLFGSGGMLERDTDRLVCGDFVVASRKPYDKGKCFYNTAYPYLRNGARNRSMFHVLWTSLHGIPVPPVDAFDHVAIGEPRAGFRRKPLPIQLNHYAVKSKAEYALRNLKGDVYHDGPTHSENSFWGRDMRCSAPDYSIFRYLSRLRKSLADSRAGRDGGRNGRRMRKEARPDA